MAWTLTACRSIAWQALPEIDAAAAALAVSQLTIATGGMTRDAENASVPTALVRRQAPGDLKRFRR